MNLYDVTQRMRSKGAIEAAFFAAAMLLFCRGADAEHGMPGYSFVFAENAPPPTNTLIPLAGTNGVPFSLRSLKQGRVRAVSEGGGHIVPLEIKDSYDDMEGHGTPFPDNGGGYGENLILLSPQTELTAGKTYSIEVDLTPDEKGSEPYVLTALTVGNTPDKTAPTWRSAPFLRLPIEGNHNDAYEGEDAPLTPTLVTAIDGLSDQPGFVIIDLSPLDAKARPKRMIATLPPKDPKTGKQPCGRVAVFDHEFNVYADDTDRDLGRRYRARLTAMDMAGNRTVAPGPGVDIVWNTWMVICNDPDEKPSSSTELPPLQWTGTPKHTLEADPDINGIATYDDASPFFERIRLPLSAKTSLFAEVSVSPPGKTIRPYRFIAKLPVPKAATPSFNDDKDASCVFATIANDDRQRLSSSPETEWDARVTLTDPLGRRLSHNGAPLRIRLSRVRLLLCTQSGQGENATMESLSAQKENKPTLKWKSFPVLRLNGLPQSVLGSDLLLVDIDAPGPVYVLITARGLKSRSGLYKFFAMIDPRGGPASNLKHGCAYIDTDPEVQIDSEEDDRRALSFNALSAVRLEIVAMDETGKKVAAPSTVIWNSPEHRLAICIPEAVTATKSAL